MSIEAAKWCWALGALGHRVLTVAGAGRADRLLPGLAWGAAEPPSLPEVVDVLAAADLVVVDNLCSLPLNPGATEQVARALRGRPAVLRHHDLPWQRPGGSDRPPPTDRRWRHVTVNELSRRQLAARGIAATTVYNAFDPCPPSGDRAGVRSALGVAPGGRLVLQPTRAIPRKAIPVALALAEALGAHYWLLGDAEEGYGPELGRLIEGCRVPVHRGLADLQVADAYAACDVVALPSTWEGFGNPAIESALHRRPLAIGPYPVATELAALGFGWFSARDAGAVAGWLDRPARGLLDRNRALAVRHFSLADLPAKVAQVLEGCRGVGPRE